MQSLRKWIQFWLGLEALILSVSLVNFFVTISKGTIHFDRARLIATVLVVLVLQLSAGIAWWTLRKAKPCGRICAMVASALALLPSIFFLVRHPGHFPFTVFTLGFLGLAGLVAFAARVDDARASKSAPAAGDGTSKFKDYFAQAVSMGFIWLAFQMWNQWAASHGLVHPRLIPYLVQLNSAVLLTTFFHELGHLAAGWASGKILRMFQIGPFRWAVRNGSWRFKFQLRKFYGGGVAMVAPDLRNMRSRKAFLLLGGPVASLLVGSIFTVATLTAAGHAWAPYWSVLSALATLSLAGCIVNLIPLMPETQYSDGAQLYQIVTNGPWARVHLAFAMVTTSAVAAVRPRDFDVNLINEAADFVSSGERGLLLRLFACKHYIDRNRIKEAVANMEGAERLYEGCKFEKPQDICAEFVFVNAFYKRDLAAADLWWQRIEAIRNVDPDADFWRAKTALLWLRGEHQEASEAWAHGNSLAQKLPSAGTYAFTRFCFDKLRTVLDAPIRTAPPSVAGVFEWPEVRAHAGAVGGHDLLPRFAASRRFVPSPHLHQPSIRVPLHGRFAFGSAGYGSRFASIDKVQAGFLLGLGGSNPLAVWGKSILSDPRLGLFTPAGPEFAPLQMASVRAGAVAGLTTRHQNTLTVR